MDANAISKEGRCSGEGASSTCPSLLESVYEKILAKELIQRGLSVHCQETILITYKGEEIKEAFKADMIVTIL